MSISFNEIPIDIRTPGHYIEFDPTRATQGLPVERHRVLIIGYSDELEAGALLQITSAAQGEALVGHNTVTADMIRAFRSINGYTDLWVLGTGSAGDVGYPTATVNFTGTAERAGVVEFHIAGRAYRVAMLEGDGAADAAARLVAAIEADPRALVTASLSAGEEPTELLLAPVGQNGLGLYMPVVVGHNASDGDGLLPGLTVAILPMSGLDEFPQLDGPLAAVGDQQFHTVITAYSDAANLTALENWLAARFGPMVQKEGHAFVGFNGDFADTTTFGMSRNSPHLTVMAGNSSPTPPWVWAAQAAARDAAEPDPARPRQTLGLPGCLAPRDTRQLMREERNMLLYAGISTYTVTPAGVPAIERLITTYKANAQGVQDTAYLDIETMRTLAYLRFTVRQRIATRYPRHKLASDGTQYGPGQAIVTPSVIRGELCALFREWEEAGLVEGFEQFKRDLIVERNTSDPNRVDAVIPPDVVNQFRVFAASVQFRL